MDTLIPLTVDAPAPAPPTAPPATSRARIDAIDVARGLALIGMVIVHARYEIQDRSALWNWLLTSPGGRASVLFFVLSGVSLSIISGRKSPSAEPSVLVKRGVVLFLFGTLMSSFWISTILPHYGVMFMLSPLLLKRTWRTLVAVIAVALLAGPVLTLLFQYNLPMFARAHSDAVVSSWALLTVNDVLFDLYPLVLWIGFFVLGMLIGRLDLGRRANGARLLVAGVVLTLATTGIIRATVDIAEGPDPSGSSIGQVDGSSTGEVGVVSIDPAGQGGRVDQAGPGEGTSAGGGDGSSTSATGDGAGSPEAGQSVAPVLIDEASTQNGTGTGQSGSGSTSPGLIDGSGSLPGGKDSGAVWETPRWRSLLSGLPHADTTMWALQAIGVALGIIGALIVLPARLLRLLGPLRRVGSISLTAYVAHTLLVQDLWVWLEPIAPDSFAWEVGRVGIAIGLLLALGWFVTRRWTQGPLEWGLHQLTRSTASGRSTSATRSQDVRRTSGR